MNSRGMASYMLKHDGKLNRWCPVQPDVEEYFRATLDTVLACLVSFCCARWLRAAWVAGMRSYTIKRCRVPQHMPCLPASGHGPDTVHGSACVV